ncbi:hypothetical protein GCM10010346_30620 [Streptomyces chryseus]|uniref:Uncharacterized protein n=1 Tax=Streptomyces chryseus TaxID=68186 RepID=A0ABQ3DM56_9ACTN|nr:hypothetical protein GCM10010346_30620 [Streptomyces chryseus]
MMVVALEARTHQGPVRAIEPCDALQLRAEPGRQTNVCHQRPDSRHGCLDVNITVHTRTIGESHAAPSMSSPLIVPDLDSLGKKGKAAVGAGGPQDADVRSPWRIAVCLNRWRSHYEVRIIPA